MAPIKKDPLERLTSKSILDDTNNCLEWQGSKDQGGYGMFTYNGHSRRAHRVSYEIQVGPIPVGLCVCHRCDNRACINPSHLFLGTLADNNADRDEKGRHVPSPGILHGSAKLTEEDVLAIRGARGGWGLKTKLANEYGVSRTQIANIRAVRNWVHI